MHVVGTHRGYTQGVNREYTQGVHTGNTHRGYTQRVHTGNTHRGYTQGVPLIAGRLSLEKCCQGHMSQSDLRVMM